MGMDVCWKEYFRDEARYADVWGWQAGCKKCMHVFGMHTREIWGICGRSKHTVILITAIGENNYAFFQWLSFCFNIGFLTVFTINGMTIIIQAIGSAMIIPQ